MPSKVQWWKRELFFSNFKEKAKVADTINWDFKLELGASGFLLCLRRWRPVVGLCDRKQRFLEDLWLGLCFWCWTGGRSVWLGLLWHALELTTRTAWRKNCCLKQVSCFIDSWKKTYISYVESNPSLFSAKFRKCLLIWNIKVNWSVQWGIYRNFIIEYYQNISNCRLINFFKLSDFLHSLNFLKAY